MYIIIYEKRYPWTPDDLTPEQAELWAKNNPEKFLECGKFRIIKAGFKNKAFARFWKEYPNRKDRSNAYYAWKKLSPTPELIGTLMSVLDFHKDSPSWQENPKLIPPATAWLNMQLWQFPMKFHEKKK